MINLLSGYLTLAIVYLLVPFNVIYKALLLCDKYEIKWLIFGFLFYSFLLLPKLQTETFKNPLIAHTRGTYVSWKDKMIEIHISVCPFVVILSDQHCSKSTKKNYLLKANTRDKYNFLCYTKMIQIPRLHLAM